MAVLPLRRASGYSIGPAVAGPDPAIGPVDIPELPPVSPGKMASDGTTRVTVNEDGSVEIDLGGKAPTKELDNKFDANIAEEMDDGPLGTLAMDLIDGIKADMQTRIALLSNYAKGIDLLALTQEEEGGSGTGKRKRTSKVRHPVMLDACTKFWASASAELLPASGPCKVRDDALSTQTRDSLAQHFQMDMNHYLTVTAREYYPDTGQMLMLLGFGGTTFKKVYHCPLRERPVSEAVRLPDLIVNEQATDLDNAIRVTHQVMMAPNSVKRLQVQGFYLNIDLGDVSPEVDPTKQKEQSIHGLGAGSTTLRPQDRDRTLYECYTDIDLSDYGQQEKGAPEGLPLPYRVTIDRDAQKILEIRRNWRKDDAKFRKRQRFVKWTMVPGFGFLGLGFLHLLGNQTKALTALWRIMIDAGMFANFPGGVKVKGTRQTTNEIAPGPGEWVEVDTGPQLDITKAFMPLPYKDLNAVMIQLSEMIGAHADKLGTSVEFPAGEGRTNIPVGTILAMIEQQTQTMSAVHRGLHRSQQEELLLLKELFAEDPEALWRGCSNPAHEWSDPAEFLDCNLVPATDPNVPSQIHRLMVATAMVTVAATNPDIYDRVAVHKHAWLTAGIADVDSYIKPQQQPGQPQDPEAMQAMAELQFKQQELQLKQQEQQRKAASESVEATQRGRELSVKTQSDAQDRASKEKVANIQQETARIKLGNDKQSDDADRAQKDDHHAMSLAVQRANATDQIAHQGKQGALDRQQDGEQHATGLAADHQQTVMGHQADMAQHLTGLAADQRQASQDRQADLAQHASGLAADRQATVLGHRADMTQHLTGLAAERAQDVAQRDHEAEQKALDRKAEASRPKPKPTSSKK